MIHTDEHVSGHFANQYTEARGTWYGTPAVPSVFFDGGNNEVGASSCPEAYNTYQPVLASLMAKHGDMSPVEITGTYSINGNTANISATFTQVDPITFSNVRASIFLWEDNITYCCDPRGGNQWNEICRYIEYHPITSLVNPGDQATVTTAVTLDPSWNWSNLYAAVILENASNPKEIYQASMLPSNGNDYSFSVPVQLASCPAGSGTVTFPATLWNLQGATDNYNVAVDQASGWPTDFQVQGDPNWYTSHTVALAANQSVQITVRMQTDATKRIGTGDFSAQSVNTGRLQSVALRLFNGSPAILFVNQDGDGSYNGVSYAQAYIDGLNQNGYLFDQWDATANHGGSGPGYGDEVGYDAIVWETGWLTGGLLSASETASLQEYLDGGGRLFLDSIGYLNSTGPSAFTQNYLGISSWTLDTGAQTESGISGDPITNGMTLPLSWPVPQANKVDTVVPASTASTILQNEVGNSNAIRNAYGTSARIVFSTVPQSVYSSSAPNPNNNKTLVGNIMAWILTTNIVGVPGSLAANNSMLLVNPNPLHQTTQLSYRLTPKAATSPVSLVLVDPAGRTVRTLASGPTVPGLRTITWDGKDESGRLAPAGIYFARLKSADGASTSKLVVLR